MDPMGGFAFGTTSAATAAQPAALPLGGGQTLAGVPKSEYASMVQKNPALASWVAPSGMLKKYLRRPAQAAESLFESQEPELRKSFGTAWRGYAAKTAGLSSIVKSRSLVKEARVHDEGRSRVRAAKDRIEEMLGLGDYKPTSFTKKRPTTREPLHSLDIHDSGDDGW